MEDLVNSLNNVFGGLLAMDRPVVDRMGLTGKYDIRLRTAMEVQIHAVGVRLKACAQTGQDAVFCRRARGRKRTSQWQGGCGTSSEGVYDSHASIQLPVTQVLRVHGVRSQSFGSRQNRRVPIGNLESLGLLNRDPH